MQYRLQPVPGRQCHDVTGCRKAQQEACRSTDQRRGSEPLCLHAAPGSIWQLSYDDSSPITGVRKKVGCLDHQRSVAAYAGEINAAGVVSRAANQAAISSSTKDALSNRHPVVAAFSPVDDGDLEAAAPIAAPAPKPE